MRQHDLILRVLLAASLTATLSPAHAQRPSATLEFGTVHQYIVEAMARDSIPSIVVAASRDGRVVWEEAFGWADREHRVHATMHTPYPLASVTKALTSTGLMLLWARGRLDLDRPVNDYLGTAKVWSPFWDPAEATVRRVGQHTAGLTTYREACYRDEPECSTSPDDMIRRYAFVSWRPGDHFDYSNLGYGVLGEAMAHIAGEPYADAIRDLVFKPLGLTECLVGPSSQAAVAYDGRRARAPVKEEVQQGATSAACSARDLLHFGMLHLEEHTSKRRSVLPDEAIRIMQDSTVATDGDARYGMGWWVNEQQHGYRIVYASGGTDDAGASLTLVPTEHIAVVVLTNTGDARGVGSQVVDMILSALLPAYGADVARGPLFSAPASVPATNGSAAMAGTWSGTVTTYLGERPLTLSIDSTGSVQLSISGEPMAPTSHTRLTNNALRFRSELLTDLGTPDSNRRHHRLGFELYLRSDELYGAVTTAPVDAPREGGLLSYPVLLHRKTP